MPKPTKDERRARRKQGRKLHNGWRIEGMYPSERPVGGGIVSATPDEVIAALEGVPADLPWPAMAPRLLPLFERVRPYPPGMPERAQAILPPGVSVSFGIDVGPGFIAITPEIIEGWSLTLGDVAAQAMANLHSRAAEVKPADVISGPLADLEARWLQTNRSIGSVLVLAPSELARIFGAAPQYFIAPMRDLLVGFPPNVDPELAAWLYGEIASEDPNCLVPRGFAFDGRNVTVERLLSPAAVA